jgi:hypothetical protein
VERVIDGDTFKTTDGRTIRLLNINAPEKNSLLSQEATAFMKQYEGKNVELESTGVDKYQRTIARIYGPDYLNLKLVQEGLASIFLVHEDELNTFAQAEREAVKQQKGIWHHSSFFGCIELSIDPQEEKVRLSCSCPTQIITNWYIKDESRKTYKFQGLCRSIVLASGEGTDTSAELFWHAGNVWNNDRDTAYLFSDKDELVAHVSYGYPQ